MVHKDQRARSLSPATAADPSATPALLVVTYGPANA